MFKKTVMVFGTFDILHAGHFYIFKQARKLGEKVIVIVARDINVKKIKGQRSFHDENERKYILSHINLIDEVILGDKKDVYKAIKIFKPDIILLGYDQINFVDGLKNTLKENNLHTKIIRAKSFKGGQYKTKKIKEHLNKFL